MRYSLIPDTRSPRLLLAEFGIVLCVVVLAGCAKAGSATQSNEKIEAPSQAAGGVSLVKDGDDWRLLRDGQPYLIRGAGGDGSMELLAKLGGNSIRTWGTDGLQEKLDDARRHGLSVCVGIWLGHTRHGFNWDDAPQVARQKETVKETVLKFKDDKSVLLWGLGNEMEGYGAGDNEVIWKAVNDLAAMVKQLDPHHPTMTVIAEIGGDRVQSIHRLCPDIDIIGINSYGGAATIPDRYRKAGGTKPYIITEFGPNGSWEVAKTSWGAAIEPSSSEKAAAYRRTYEKAVLKNPGTCLGSYAFVFGHKQEATATWFGMLLPDGSRLAAADAMSALWSGKPLANVCPVLRTMTTDGPSENDPGAVVQARLEVDDPDNDVVQIKWILQADPMTRGVGGDAEAIPPTFPDAIIKANERQADVRLPMKAGAYRLYAYASDGHGGSAVANIPLLVKGTVAAPIGTKAKLPFVIYDEAGRNNPPYIPSGWMGNTKAMKYDEKCSTNPHSGQSCIRIDFNSNNDFGAIAWQHPENDWGDKPGGWDLSGAKRLSVWLRGDTGDEICNIELGILGGDKKFPDTAKAKLENIRLSNEWREYSLEVVGNLTRIKTGLVVSIPGQGRPIRVFIDDCKYE